VLDHRVVGDCVAGARFVLLFGLWAAAGRGGQCTIDCVRTWHYRNIVELTVVQRTVLAVVGM